MSELIMKAEQGVLGALLATRDDTVLIHDHLTADDFGHPAHQAVFAALSELQYSGYATERLTAAAAVIADRDDVDTTWLTSLATGAPSEAHVRAYMRIVLAAAFDRDSADFAGPYLAPAELETDPDAEASLLRTGHALEAQAEVFAASSIISPDTLVVVTTAAGERELTREEKIIADLLQHPEQAEKVAAWLSPEVFASEQRRMAFEITVSTAYHGDPVDPVIVAWELERTRELNTYYERETTVTDQRTEPDYPYMTRLAATAVVTGTAIVVGHELLSEHTAATLALSATAAMQRQAATAATLNIHHPPLEAPLTAGPVADRRIEL